MVVKLNWNVQKMRMMKIIKLNRLSVLLIFILSINVSAQQDTTPEEEDRVVDHEHGITGNTLKLLDTIVAKTNKIIVDEDTLPVYAISVGKVGAVFPCGSRFGISLQAPGYHMFSSESAYNATFIPGTDEIQWPNSIAEKNNQVYQKTFDRIKAMRVGTVEGSFGKRWTISAEQFQSNYDNMFNFELNGQQKLAGDYGNMFFEMLISIQQLSKENDELKKQLINMKDRLATIEANLNIGRTEGIENRAFSKVEISPNPSSSKVLNISYNINSTVVKAVLHIVDVNGRTINKFEITEREGGHFTQFVDLSAGAYFYQLITDGHKGETTKLIIN